jgi:dienelactone hydrolase
MKMSATEGRLISERVLRLPEVDLTTRMDVPAPLPRSGVVAGKDFTTTAAAILETELTAAGFPHDLKVCPGAKHAFFNDTLRSYHDAAAADS